MPVLARFYGIVIRMYFLGAEHNPPHIHAIYGDDTAAFDIRTGEMLDGIFRPRRGTREGMDVFACGRAFAHVGNPGV